MSDSRLLDYRIAGDFEALKSILDFYVDTQSTIRNSAWLPVQAEIIRKNVLESFTDSAANNFLVSGTFENNQLETICVGTTFNSYMPFVKANFMPSWIMYLMCSRDISFSNPASKIFNAGTHLVRHMESIGYTSFYQIFKFPNLRSNEDICKYIDKSFEQMSVMDRYVNLIEYIHLEDRLNDESMKFILHRYMLGRNFSGNRKICITSHHLKNEYRKFDL